jgi:hypothetical protein
MRPVETIPGLERGEIKEYVEGSQFKNDIFDIL